MSKNTKKEILNLMKYQDELLKKIKELEDKNELLKSEKEVLINENKSLKDKNKLLKDESVSLGEMIEKNKSLKVKDDKRFNKLTKEILNYETKCAKLEKRIDELQEKNNEDKIYYINLIRNNNDSILKEHRKVVRKTIGSLGFNSDTIYNSSSLLYIDKKEQVEEFNRAIRENEYYHKCNYLIDNFRYDLDNSKGKVDYLHFFSNDYYLEYLMDRASLYAIAFKEWKIFGGVFREKTTNKYCKELYEMTLSLCDKIYDLNKKR